MARHQAGDILEIGEVSGAVYGHVTAEELHAAHVKAGIWLEDDPVPEVNQGWWRWTPAQPGDDYDMRGWPAEPHSQGAFPLTLTE